MHFQYSTVTGSGSLQVIRRLAFACFLVGLCLAPKAVALPDDVKFTITASITGVSTTQTLNLHKRSARTSDFTLLTWDAANGYVVVSPTPEVRTYRGTVSENPNALVIASINASNVMSVSCFDRVANHNTLWTATVNVSSQLVSPAVPAPMPAQTVAAPRDGSEGTPLIGPKVPTGAATNGVNYGEMVEFELAGDLFVAAYNRAGNSLDNTLAAYEFNAMLFEQTMARDLLVRVVVPAVVIRKENFYPTDPRSGTETTLRAEWLKAPLKDLPWDNVWGSEGASTAATGIGRDENFAALGTMQYVAYKWGATPLSYQGDIMGGNNPSIGPITVEEMRAKREEAINEGKLSQAQPYTDPLAPFTHVDIARINMNTGTDIDVLANDMDANGDVLTLSDFTTSTVPGGTVTLNPNGTLRYVPPANFTGKDVIVYTARDNSPMGLKTREIVHIEVVNNGLAARFAFEETTGAVGANAVAGGSPAGLNGANFATNSVPSPLGRGVRAAGIALGVRNVMPIPVNSATPFEASYNQNGGGYDPMEGDYTFSTWFRCDNFANAGYIASKRLSPENAVSWDMRVLGNKLYLYWRIFQGPKGLLTLTAPSYAYIPGKWYHVATVFDRTTGEIRLYLDGTKVATKVDAFPGNGVIFNGRSPLFLGNSTNQQYCFDDARVYTKALDDADVRALYVEPGVVPRFLVPSLTFSTFTGFAIQKTNLWSSIWSGGGPLTFSMVSGPAWLHVDSGGNLTGTPGTPDVGTSVAVVRITDGLGLSADLPLNLTVVDALLRAHWRFNEDSGTTAVDSSGNGNTATLSGATWGSPREGASSLNTNSSANQYAQAVPLDTTGGLTIAGWVRPTSNNGGQTIISQEGSYTLQILGSSLWFTSATSAGSYGYISSNLGIVANQWQHVMVVYKPGTGSTSGVKFYQNGVLKLDETSYPPGLSQTSSPTLIGKNAGTAGYTGDIDDLRVFGLALGDAEALALYAAVPSYNPPAFPSDPIYGSRVPVGVAYSGVLTASDVDPGTTMVFTKVSGPAWLTVAPDGTLNGTPGQGDLGTNSFVVRVTDNTDQTDTAALTMMVGPSLLAQWEFDEGSGTLAADSSGSANDATVVDATWTAPRVGTFSLTTNGTAAQYAQAGPLDTRFGFTIAAWIKPASVCGIHTFISQQNSYALRSNDTGLFFTTPSIKDHYSSGLRLVADEWQHVAVSFRAGTVGGAKFYLNGVLKSSVDASGLSQSTNPTILGRALNWTGEDYSGGIDDLRFYGTPLNASDITAIYSSYPGPKAPFFTSDPIVGADAIANAPYIFSLASEVSDPDAETVFAFSKVSGPAWLTVSEDGSLGGIPGHGNLGANAFVVKVTDPTGLSASTALNIAVGADPATEETFQTWITRHGLSGTAAARFADSDQDGFTNFAEFALDGNPASGTLTNKIAAKITTIGGDGTMTLTLPILTGATADPGDPEGGALGLVSGGVKYSVEASADLVAWSLSVSEVTPVLTTGMPTLSAGYQYRSFRIANPVAGNPVGYLRVKITQ